MASSQLVEGQKRHRMHVLVVCSDDKAELIGLTPAWFFSLGAVINETLTQPALWDQCDIEGSTISITHSSTLFTEDQPT